MEQNFTNLRGKFVSVTFARQCESAGVRRKGGFVNELVDLAVGGLDRPLIKGLAQVMI